jgi:hypothetical protein
MVTGSIHCDRWLRGLLGQALAIGFQESNVHAIVFLAFPGMSLVKKTRISLTRPVRLGCAQSNIRV